MKELIEKQAIIDALLAKMDTIDDKPDVVLGMAVAAAMIKDMPSALEQEPCDDCISRQDAVYACRNGWGYDDETIEHIVGNILELPSVTPAEKVGRWVKTIGENGVTSAVRCSECGFEDNRYMMFRYCPKCKAKMREVEE